jgi:hypothetical protein
MTGRINEQWHREHVLGSHAPMDRRVEWHLAHARECACRPIPASVRAELERRGLEPPPDRGP